MRHRKLWLGLLVSALALLAPTAAFAAATQPFSATGGLQQKEAGAVGIDEDTGALLRLGQKFEGSLTESKWGAIKNTQVKVTHNSALGADLESLEVCFVDDTAAVCSDGVPLFGIGWGEFTLSKGQGNQLAGKYKVAIGGTVRLVPPTVCAPDPVLQLPLWVDVHDQGGWELDGPSRGALGQINDGGPIVVMASGCMGDETASLTVAGTRLGG